MSKLNTWSVMIPSIVSLVGCMFFVVYVSMLLNKLRLIFILLGVSCIVNLVESTSVLVHWSNTSTGVMYWITMSIISGDPDNTPIQRCLNTCTHAFIEIYIATARDRRLDGIEITRILRE